MYLHLGANPKRIELETSGWSWIEAFSHNFQLNPKNQGEELIVMMDNDQEGQIGSDKNFSEIIA